MATAQEHKIRLETEQKKREVGRYNPIKSKALLSKKSARQQETTLYKNENPGNSKGDKPKTY
jgi:hypothetical protein